MAEYLLRKWLGERVVEVKANIGKIELKMHLDIKVLSKTLTQDYKTVILHHDEEVKSTCSELKLYEYLNSSKVIAPSIPSKLYLS